MGVDARGVGSFLVVARHECKAAWAQCTHLTWGVDWVRSILEKTAVLGPHSRSKSCNRGRHGGFERVASFKAR